MCKRFPLFLAGFLYLDIDNYHQNEQRGPTRVDKTLLPPFQRLFLILGFIDRIRKRDTVMNKDGVPMRLPEFANLALHRRAVDKPGTFDAAKLHAKLCHCGRVHFADNG